MIEFIRLDKNVQILKPYIEKSEINFCDISLGVRYIWRDSFKVDYCIFDDTLILKESCKDYENAFYFPMGKNVKGALTEIEKYCKAKDIPLIFCCIDNYHATVLTERYIKTEVYNLRDWSDYVYDSKEFREFTGKKYSGQRNHINKFKKLYPNATVKIIEKKDVEKLQDFLYNYEKENDISSWSAIEEEKKLRDYIFEGFSFGQFGLYVQDGEKIIGFSMGETLNDTLIVHVEKALKEYEGVYPFLANAFAKTFGENVSKINREEDCGDVGLRISKLQYHPIEIKEKNIIKVYTLFPDKEIEFFSERLTYSPVLLSDKTEYFNLYTDKELNEFWGYDYKEDLKGEKETEEYFYNFQKTLKDKKEEYSLAIRKDGKMIGELVLWNFDYFGNVEIGYRIIKSEQNKGYGKESVKAFLEFIRKNIKPNLIKARCYIKNESSLKILKNLNFNEIGCDSKKKYFAVK